MAYMPCIISIITLLLYHTSHINTTHCIQWVNLPVNYHKTLMKTSQTTVGKYVQVYVHTYLVLWRFLLHQGHSVLHQIHHLSNEKTQIITESNKLLCQNSNTQAQFSPGVILTGFELMAMTPCLLSNISGAMPVHTYVDMHVTC